MVPHLTINGTQLEHIVELKNNIVVVFDEHMSWKPHTTILSNRFSKYAAVYNANSAL